MSSHFDNLRREMRIFADDMRNAIGNELGEFRERLRALEARLAALERAAPADMPLPKPGDPELGPSRDLTKPVAYINERGMYRVLNPGEFLGFGFAKPPPPKTSPTEQEMRLALRECGHDFEDGSGLNVATGGLQELPNSVRFYRRFRERYCHYAPAGDPDKALREMQWRGIRRRGLLGGGDRWLKPGDAEFDRIVSEGDADAAA